MKEPNIIQDHGEAHPRVEFRHDLAEYRSDAQDQRQLEDEVITDNLHNSMTVLNEQVRILNERVELLVTLVTAVAARL